MKGLIHIYCGDGKGKTSAALGLAVRAAGSGLKVLAARFLKNFLDKREEPRSRDNESRHCPAGQERE